MCKNFLRIENGAANQAIIGITAFVSFVFGGYTPLLKSYLVLMLFDFITAIIYHIGNRSLNSWQAFTGLLRKIMCLIIIFAAYHAEQFIGVELPIKDIILAYLAILELVSIMENAEKFGIKLPAKIVQKIRDYMEGLNK